MSFDNYVPHEGRLPPVGADQTSFVPTTAVSAGGARDRRSRWVMVAHYRGQGVVCINEFGTNDTRCRLVKPEDCRWIHSSEQGLRGELRSLVVHAEHVAGFAGFGGAVSLADVVVEYIISNYILERRFSEE